MEDELAQDLLSNDRRTIPLTLGPRLKYLAAIATVILIPYILIIVLFVRVSEFNSGGNAYNTVEIHLIL